MDLPMFALFLVACCAAGSTGALFPPDGWYRQLSKPGWTPPDWLFPLAWTALYIAIAAATALASQTSDPALPLAVFAVQIALNTLWSPIFFGLKRLGAAMVALSALWLSVVAMVVTYWQATPIAGALVVPYLVWVSYAGALNWVIWRRNMHVAPPQEA